MKFSEKVKCFYEEIKLITEEIGKTGLPDKLIEAAKKKDKNEVKAISIQFKEENLELWGRIALFYEKYCEDSDHIFGDEEEGLNTYNPDDIDPLNLCILLALSFENVDEDALFDDWRELQSAISKKGYRKIANYMDYKCFNDLESLIQAYS